ncbi:zf-HC2 domain-containing protein [candidate division KSB1 bacterium]|nr:zf-HC2 domain-containing protein [candidate division KSB1 bacterium]
MSKTPTLSLTCSRAKEQLHLLLDNELPAADHERLLGHLQTCEQCSAAYRELRAIEAAHAELDARATEVPETYFDSLPQKVLARIAQAEAAQEKPRLLTWRPRSFNLREYIWGRGKYALAFAAMLTLIFLVTRDLREQKQPETVLREVMDADLPERVPPTEARAAREDLQTSEAAQSATGGEQPAPHENFTTKFDAKDLRDEPPLAAAPPAEKSEIRQHPESRADSERMLLQAAAPRVEAMADTIAAAESSIAGAQQFVNNPPTGRARLYPESKAEALYEEAETPQAFSKAARITANDTRLAHALSASVQAQSQTERLKIWQDYFVSSQRDSATYHSAVENLARRLAAQSDSSSAVTQMQEALTFYQTMEAILAARWGRAAYEHERARLEGLLNWKKPAHP